MLPLFPLVNKDKCLPLCPMLFKWQKTWDKLWQGFKTLFGRSTFFSRIPFTPSCTLAICFRFTNLSLQEKRVSILDNNLISRLMVIKNSGLLLSKRSFPHLHCWLCVPVEQNDRHLTRTTSHENGSNPMVHPVTSIPALLVELLNVSLGVDYSYT